MIAFLIGTILGIVYFGGLYFSVRKMSKVKYPSLLMITSFFLRMGVLVGVFFYTSKGGYKDMLFTFLGLMLVRFVMIFTLKEQSPNSIKRGD